MVKGAALNTARRYVDLLKKHDIPVLSAYLFGSFASGKSNVDSDIDIALVLDHYVDTPENCLVFMRYRREVDLRIEPHPFDKQDFYSGDPFVDAIKATGIKLD
jgi:predicted nucleotidyltransferase